MKEKQKEAKQIEAMQQKINRQEVMPEINPEETRQAGIRKKEAILAETQTKAEHRYLRPKRAAEKMRRAKKELRTVYLYGPSGAGKTSLIRDVLARWRYLYWKASEETGPERDRERAVVIDDLQCLEESRRERILEVLKTLDENPYVWLILISRSPVPGWLKPLYLSSDFAMIDERDLGFSEKEAEEYFRLWDVSVLAQTMRELYAKAEYGYPLLFRAAAMRLKNEPPDPDGTLPDRAGRESEAVHLAGQDVLDYFEKVVLQQWRPELSNFLMKLSVVDSFRAETAREITGEERAARLLQQAYEIGSLLEPVCGKSDRPGCRSHAEPERCADRTNEQADGCRMHPAADGGLYRMRAPVRRIFFRILERHEGKEEILQLYHAAAAAYEKAGDIPEALELYRRCGDDAEIFRLLTANMQLHPGNGFYWEMRRYYLALPEQMIRTDPDLMAGMSMLYSILMDVEQSEFWYHALKEYAEGQTEDAYRAARIRLLWLDISLLHRSTDSLIPSILEAAVFLESWKMPMPELSLTLNLPSILNGGRDLSDWIQHDRSLIRVLRPALEQIFGHRCQGLLELALAESLFEKGENDDEVRELLGRFRIRAESDPDAEQSFASVRLTAWMSVLDGKSEEGAALLDAVSEPGKSTAAQQRRIRENIRTAKARIALYTGRTGELGSWMEQAPNEEAEFCALDRYHYMAKIRIYLSGGQKQKALALTEQMLYCSRIMKRPCIRIECELLLSVILYRMKRADWTEHAQRAVSGAEHYHFVRLLSREGAAAEQLIRDPRIVWRDPAFQEQVLQECSRMARQYPAYLREKKNVRSDLGDRALFVLRMHSEGRSMEQIAEALGVTVSTVKYYNKEIYRKLGVNSRAEAVAEAKNRKII